MYKLRQTWSDVLPARKLYALDVRVNQIDPAWPIVPFASSASSDGGSSGSKSASSIHINPKFLQKSSPSAGSAASSSAAKPAMVRTQLSCAWFQLLLS